MRQLIWGVRHYQGLHSTARRPARPGMLHSLIHSFIHPVIPVIHIFSLRSSMYSLCIRYALVFALHKSHVLWQLGTAG